MPTTAVTMAANEPPPPDDRDNDLPDVLPGSKIRKNGGMSPAALARTTYHRTSAYPTTSAASLWKSRSKRGASCRQKRVSTANISLTICHRWAHHHQYYGSSTVRYATFVSNIASRWWTSSAPRTSATKRQSWATVYRAARRYRKCCRTNPISKNIQGRHVTRANTDSSTGKA